MILENKLATLFASNLGATVTGFQIGETHVLFPQQKVMVGQNLQLRGGVPIMHPWFGPHPNPAFGRHGFIRNQIFEATDKTSLLGFFTHRFHKSRICYPWDFVFLGSATVHENGFSIGATVKNLSLDTAMPINTGFHPYLMMPQGIAAISFPKDNLTIDVDSITAKMAKSQVLAVVPNPAVIEIPGLGTIKIICQKAQATVVWTDSPRYLCVEPVLRLPETYFKAAGVWVEPSDTYHFDMRVTVKLETN